MKKKNLLELKKLTLEEVKKYYVELREYEYENRVPLEKIKERKKIHPILLKLIEIDRKLSHEEITIIGDKRVKTDRQKVYACTHIGGNDIQRTFEAIKDHAYLFLGDPEGIYTDLTGVILSLNGAICLETNNKKDRHIAYMRSLELLKKHGSLLIYPEGAWNITDNLLVTKLYEGAVKMAKQTNSEIVPIAIEQYDNNFFINIGKNYMPCEDLTIEEENRKLRDILATLKWEIFESQGYKKREEIDEFYGENFRKAIIDKCEYGFTEQDVYDTMYKDKNEVSYDEVFEFRKRLK